MTHPIQASTRTIEQVLRFEIHSFWHPGSGRGDATLADAAVHRTAEGLPFLPGRTVKGLLRDAAELAVAAGFLTLEEVVEAFGTALPRGAKAESRVGPLEAARYATQPGSLTFTSAFLGRTPGEQEAWRAFARTHEAARDQLFTRFSSTRIEADGIARDGTLRATELVVPMTLHARITGPEDTPWDALGDAALFFIRGLGSGRHRGLGRVSVHLEVS